jgi:cytochrome c553
MPHSVEPIRLLRFTIAWLFAGSLVLLVGSAGRAEEVPGAQVYVQKCASCHGPQGEGTEDYPDSLIGDRSVRELAELITQTMPEGEPEECVGEEAEQVARYIYDSFYSDLARERNRPATIEFARLTVRQYEQAVADLLGSYSWRGKWDDERGLSAHYFNDRRFRGNKRVIERTDPLVSFDFGTEVPEEFPELTEEEQKALEEEQKKARSEEPFPRPFSIRWEGSLLAPETGEYEFTVETPNGMRLWINETREPLIDAWVQSGDETRHSARIRLLAGRIYPVKLEMFRYREPEAFVHFKWKVPHRAEELIPERAFAPHRWPATFVLTTPFPPDDRSIGYERGTAISKEWIDATTQAALEVAAFVEENLQRLAEVKDDADNREEKLREFCVTFVERAFRRPLSEEDRSLLIDRQFAEAPTPEEAVKRVVLLALKSPRFLYREAKLGPFDDFAVASWLSFSLWDSLPDRPLLEAASRGELRTAEQITRHADRMSGDPRTWAKLREFLYQWLNVEHFPDLAKDPELYPDFDERVVSDLRTSLDLFLEEVVWSETSDYRQLLLADWVYLNDRLAEIYDADLPEGQGFRKVSLEREGRAGVLSHPLMMAGFGYDKTSSPIHRGVFLSRNVLGRRLKPPPEAVSPLSPDLHEGMTTRERVQLQTSPAACQRCHAMIDPLGFSLEQFDAIGRFRTEEKGKPIDASGRYLERSGEEATFTGSRELAEFLAGTPETHEAFAERLFQHTVKQPVRAFGENRLEELRRLFAENEFHIRHLLREIVVTSALTAREHLDRETAASE